MNEPSELAKQVAVRLWMEGKLARGEFSMDDVAKVVHRNFDPLSADLESRLAERDAELAAVRADCAEFRAVICELIDAEHYDHFESWLNEGEMKAINKMRAIANRQKGSRDDV